MYVWELYVTLKKCTGELPRYRKMLLSALLPYVRYALNSQNNAELSSGIAKVVN